MTAEKMKTPSHPQYAEWHGYFYGHDLTFLHAELLAIKNIPDALLKKESELMQSKWFDYRRMHPTKATYLLAKEYDRAYRDMQITIKDMGGEFMRGFKGLDFMNSKECKSFWRLRQAIDTLGIRYDFFMRHAMNWCIANGHRQPPRPQHVYTNDEMITDIRLKWEEEQSASIQYCKDDRYNVENFFGHTDQLAYEAFLIGQIKSRQHPEYALHNAIYVRKTLRIEEALRNFEVGIIESTMQKCSDK